MDDFFERCMKACRIYRVSTASGNVLSQPPGWLIITERQKRDLLMSPSMQFITDPSHLISRMGPLGSLMGISIHIAEPGDKIPDWLLYSSSTIDMRGDRGGQGD